MNRRDEILQKSATIKLLPSTVIHVIPMFQDPETPIAELGKAIECDPGLTTNILRLANSAYFGSPRPIGSINEAILHLGTENVFRIVMSAVMVSIGRASIKGYGLENGKLWEHSFTVATCVDILSSHTGRNSFKYGYTAGLLHDIGKVVLGAFVEVDSESIMKNSFDRNLSFEQAERIVLGIDHAEVGAALLQLWHLPEVIVETARWHHEPEKINQDFRNAVDLVHVADAITTMAGIGVGDDGLNYHLSNDSSKRLQLTTKMIDSVAFEVLNQLADMKNWMNSERM